MHPNNKEITRMKIMGFFIWKGWIKLYYDRGLHSPHPNPLENQMAFKNLNRYIQVYISARLGSGVVKVGSHTVSL